ncbi:MAG: choice-of-anchor B family protein, partial [Bacteroidetes bacterium]|nr:choice-of-anchor B family protein [Bacteroidota bacterium]
MKNLFLLVFILFSSSMLLAQSEKPASKNLSLLGHLAYPMDLNDVWAYVDSAGNEYALVGTIAGLSIVDVNDPTNPSEIHFIPGDTSIWRDMHIFQHYAYTSNETGGGTLIVDLSELPQKVTYKDTILGGFATAHNLWIEDGYLYTIGIGGSGFLIFDLNNDPWNPEFTGFYLNRYVHDLYVRGNIGYSAEVFAGLLTVIDLSDKSDPKVIATHDYPGSFTHAAWLNDAGNVCFTMDELSRAYTIAWDVSDPSDIKELDRIHSSLSHGYAAPHNVHVLNDFLINSVYADGLQVVDAARPGNLVEVGYYDTSPRVGAGLRGCWGAYPFLPSGIILASDMGEGLFILQPEFQRACYLEGNTTNSANGSPLSNVKIEIIGTDVIDYSKTTGDYAIGIADSGEYEVIFSKYGYNRETRKIKLSNGVLHIENVALTPA